MATDPLSAVHDRARLAAVRASALADSPAEEAFDRLAGLAALLLDAPLAFVTVVDEERSWYKSGIGLPEGADRSGPVESSFCKYVIATGEALLVDDARADPRTCANPGIDTMGVAAWAGFPVHAPSGEVLGTFCVVDTVPRHWSHRDVVILETLSKSATSEIALRALLGQERARRADAEVAAEEAEVAAKSSAELAASLLESSERLAVLARTLQQSLLPPHLPRVPGVQVAAYFVPAASGEEVVGDFYDVFEGRRGAWCVLLGDVAGKGPEAATLTAMARYTLRAAAARSVQPRKILAALNAAMLHQRPDDDRFLTVAFATLRRIDERLVLSVCSAGHPPPLVRRADGEVELACPPGMPMGMFERPTLVEAKVELGPGDAVVFYSDGVTEARRGSDELGMERLRDLVRDAPATDAAGLVTYIETEVAAFTQGLPRDDTAVLVLRVPLL